MKFGFISITLLILNSAFAYNPIVSCTLYENKIANLTVTALPPIAGGQKGAGITNFDQTTGGVVKGFVAMSGGIVVVNIISLNSEMNSYTHFPYLFNRSLSHCAKKTKLSV
jgi:hypothetical protein